MKYFLRQMVIGKTTIIPIDAERYDELKKCHQTLFAAKAIEEKYDLMIANYLELEKEVLVQIANHMILSKKSYDEFYDLRTVLNRRLVNLVTSTKLYYDQMKIQVRTCDLDGQDLDEKALSLFSVEYDAFFEYRFMEKLRNYIQHCGLAVHLLNLPMEWQGEGEKKRMSNTLNIYSTAKELEKDKKFRQGPILGECPEKIDLMKSVRIYIERLSHIHSEIRKLIELSVSRARDVTENTLNEYKELNDQKIIGLYAYGESDETSSTNIKFEFPVLLDWDDVRINLLAKNKKLINLSKRYVTGQGL